MDGTKGESEASGVILCVGEVLWDALPDGLFLGGAVFNAACHLTALGERALFASRVGDDELGREIHRRLVRRGLDPGLLQVDRSLPTGFVVVSLDAAGSPSFEILAPSAWDAIETTPSLLAAAEGARFIVHGSLAQRGSVSRSTLRRLMALGVPRMVDVNLRPPFVDRSVVEQSLQGATAVKLNEDEWRIMTEWFSLSPDARSGAESLADRMGLETLCITRGAHGAALWHRGVWVEHPGYRVDVVDAVGAGDAFLAALLHGLLQGLEPAVILEEANALGAFVASCRGATPVLNADALARIRRGGPEETAKGTRT
jgi:fructokinase